MNRRQLGTLPERTTVPTTRGTSRSTRWGRGYVDRACLAPRDSGLQTEFPRTIRHRAASEPRHHIGNCCNQAFSQACVFASPFIGGETRNGDLSPMNVPATLMWNLVDSEVNYLTNSVNLLDFENRDSDFGRVGRREKPCPTKKRNPLGSDPPSHGRRLHSLRIVSSGR